MKNKEQIAKIWDVLDSLNVDVLHNKQAIIKLENERETLAAELLDVDLSSELTGSDYCHSGIASRLLERGQKLVVCFVSNVSEADALNKKNIEVITSVDTEFNDADDYGWEFVIPINNQGEPLTASEVGL